MERIIKLIDERVDEILSEDYSNLPNHIENKGKVKGLREAQNMIFRIFKPADQNIPEEILLDIFREEE